jgi:hypothetical protein
MVNIVTTEYAVDSEGQQYRWHPTYLRYVALKKEFWIDLSEIQNKI